MFGSGNSSAAQPPDVYPVLRVPSQAVRRRQGYTCIWSGTCPAEASGETSKCRIVSFLAAHSTFLIHVHGSRFAGHVLPARPARLAADLEPGVDVNHGVQVSGQVNDRVVVAMAADDASRVSAVILDANARTAAATSSNSARRHGLGIESARFPVRLGRLAGRYLCSPGRVQGATGNWAAGPAIVPV